MTTGAPGLDHPHLLAGHDRAEADQRALRAEHERLEDEVVVAGQQGDRPRQLFQHPHQIEEAAGVEGRLLDRHDAVDAGQRAQRLRVEVDAAERRLQLKQDQGQTDLGDRLVIADRHLGVERGAEVGGDGEDEERLGPGRLEVTRLLDGLAGERSAQPGHDRQLAVQLVGDDLDDAHFFAMRQVRPFAGVGVDRQRHRALIADPADVAPQLRLVDLGFGRHRQDRRRDQPFQVECHTPLRLFPRFTSCRGRARRLHRARPREAVDHRHPLSGVSMESERSDQTTGKYGESTLCTERATRLARRSR